MHRLLDQFVKHRTTQPEQVDLQHHQEPAGHIHPNFRHMTWFRRVGTDNNSTSS